VQVKHYLFTGQVKVRLNIIWLQGRSRSGVGSAGQRSDRGDKQDNRNLASREEEYK